MGIEELPLAWRWTQASHAVLPPDVLGSLAPVLGHEADHLYRRGEAVFRCDTAAAAMHHTSEDPETTRVWLKTLTFPSSARVLVVWDRETAISLPWQAFVAYWDDFCYPSSDDIFVFSQEGTSALAWNHDEVFEFIEDAA